jgi:ribose/xylose/arabinose/galactoside ABC-type transport system permease subunit
MTNGGVRRLGSHLLADYGMVFVLVLLGAFYSAATWAPQDPNGALGARRLAAEIQARFKPGARVLVVAGGGREDREFAEALGRRLADAGLPPVATVAGEPREAKKALERLAAAGEGLDVIAGNKASAAWLLLSPDRLSADFPSLAGAAVVRPASYGWPNFLKRDNLMNVANQIAVIAILAVGMTLVIVTGGIDLSVGSLIALAAVVATRLVRDLAGGEQAGALGMVLACLAAMLACAAVGLFSGLMVTAFSIPPFIVTLGMMLVASGLAFILAAGQSIYQVPESFVWLGRGASVPGLPNCVVLMLLLYAAAHVLMTHTALGRYVYAIGGNAEAAWLSGVPVSGVLLFTYALSGALAGLGGIVMASQLRSGAPTYGQMYELYAIAAVVVGGTSLQGGDGRVLGTLVGAFIIAVIQNGMNLTGVESYTQKVVLGLVILGAVLLDMMKRRGFRLFAG